MNVFVFVPSILLSGFMFPLAGMPRLAQWIAEVFLSRILSVSCAAPVWRMSSARSLALAVLGLVTMLLSIVRFRKRLD